jgi:nicotinamide-nucleotide amidase
MKRMWVDQVAPDLGRNLVIRPPLRALFRVIGLGESQLQELLGDIPEAFPGVELGFRTRAPENQVKLVAEPRTPRFTDACEEVRRRLGSRLVSEDENRGTATVVGDLLVERGQKLALAESCTGGLVGHLCVSEAGSSRWLDRGFITYSNEAKSESIGVPPATIEEHGAVSEPTVLAMAEGAARTAGVAWGLAVTGIAGPGGGTAEKPVGTVWIGVSGPSGTRARKLFLPSGDRNTTRRWSALLALEMLRRDLLRGG